MPKFIPLGSDGKPLAHIELNEDNLQKLRSTLMLALDYSPHTQKFREMMEPVRDLLADAFDKWIESLGRIKGGENMHNTQFLLDDWIDTWHIIDYIDATWTVAHVDYAEMTAAKNDNTL